MEKYTCRICKKEIENYEDGNFVKVTDSKGNLLEVVPVHKGECDELLEAIGRENGLNTTSSQEISSFDTKEERQKYLNGTFTMTDDELYNKIFNPDGTLKVK